MSGFVTGLKIVRDLAQEVRGRTEPDAVAQTGPAALSATTTITAAVRQERLCQQAVEGRAVDAF